MKNNKERREALASLIAGILFLLFGYIIFLIPMFDEPTQSPFTGGLVTKIPTRTPYVMGIIVCLWSAIYYLFDSYRKTSKLKTMNNEGSNKSQERIAEELDKSSE